MAILCFALAPADVDVTRFEIVPFPLRRRRPPVWPRPPPASGFSGEPIWSASTTWPAPTATTTTNASFTAWPAPEPQHVSPASSPSPVPLPTSPTSASHPQQQHTPEYSIFVGDLAPEASNTDLVAVFRNPILGLRSDRAPKFIRPFTSCKSAKIMLDPVTGVSRGYGFVRFSDEADQQRALVEMHGLYCLSRPMRISPATAKARPAFPGQGQAPAAMAPMPAIPPAQAQPPVLLPPPPNIPSSVSAPLALEQYIQPLRPPATTATAVEREWAHHAHARAILAAAVANGNANPSSPAPIPLAAMPNAHFPSPSPSAAADTDQYNTTVFVGGLSPAVTEPVLQALFAPFGEIHYVKVPPGKNCGFVQFVRKEDAERAIERMQGFALGGGMGPGTRMRLSWGRSQQKASQAAALAASAAAATASPGPTQAPPTQSLPPQHQHQQPLSSYPSSVSGPNPVAAAPSHGITPEMLAGMPKEQIVMLLQHALFGDAGHGSAPSANVSATNGNGYHQLPSTSSYPSAPQRYTDDSAQGRAGAWGGTGPTYLGDTFGGRQTSMSPSPYQDLILSASRSSPPSAPPSASVASPGPTPISSSFAPFSPEPNAGGRSLPAFVRDGGFGFGVGGHLSSASSQQQRDDDQFEAASSAYRLQSSRQEPIGRPRPVLQSVNGQREWSPAAFTTSGSVWQ
ncbi:hypothetical protein HMN09_00860200 [Mycena chlorophos]|uniref:RRM domain-containing protein n=1 Tax=Mycena chlorophos TaxID=658473 RepID=A0A8H6ST25_MYCCL|nr:hypothetical protein HMN09_00860200 [Mycena chlorophos]